MSNETAQVEYQEANFVLFTRRNEITESLAEFKGVTTLTAVQQRKVRKLTRELDDVTAEIIESNLGLVKSYARKFTRNSNIEDAKDYEAAGVVGLMRAIENFDPSLGKFGHWAYKPIQREILRAVREAEFKPLNTGDFERRPKIIAAYNLLSDKSGRRATTDEVTVEVEYTREQVRRVLEAPRLDSLSHMVGGEKDTEIGDLIAIEESDAGDKLAARAMLKALESFGLTTLDDRELFVLVRRFGLDSEPEQNLATIGHELGLSREAVRQVESKALAKLQHPVVLRRVYRNGRS